MYSSMDKRLAKLLPKRRLELNKIIDKRHKKLNLPILYICSICHDAVKEKSPASEHTAICQPCRLGLLKFKYEIRLLKRAIKYLSKDWTRLVDDSFEVL